MMPDHEPDWPAMKKGYQCKADCVGLREIGAQGYSFAVLHLTGHPGLDSRMRRCLKRCLVRKKPLVVLPHLLSGAEVYLIPGGPADLSRRRTALGAQPSSSPSRRSKR